MGELAKMDSTHFKSQSALDSRGRDSLESLPSYKTKGVWEYKTREVFSKNIKLNPSQITIHRHTNYGSNCSSTLSKFVTEPLTIQEFKTYEAEMTTQQREKIRVIRKYFKSIND